MGRGGQRCSREAASQRVCSRSATYSPLVNPQQMANKANRCKPWCPGALTTTKQYEDQRECDMEHTSNMSNRDKCSVKIYKTSYLIRMLTHVKVNLLNWQVCKETERPYLNFNKDSLSSAFSVWHLSIIGCKTQEMGDITNTMSVYYTVCGRKLSHYFQHGLINLRGLWVFAFTLRIYYQES